MTLEEKIAKVEKKLESFSTKFEKTAETYITPKKEKNLEVVFRMDSNAKFFKFKKFWTLNKSMRRRIYTQQQLKMYIQNLEVDSILTFLIHVGVNDIDTKTGEEVFGEIQENVHLLKTKFPGIKIVLAELTPRKDAKDAEVNVCNNLINEWALREEIFVAITPTYARIRTSSYMAKNT